MIKPHLTEKAVMNNKAGVYIFEVEKKYNKNMIKVIIEDMFKVNVVSVNIINMLGKSKKFRGNEGKRKNLKKAIIRLKEKQIIPGFEAESDEKSKKKKIEDKKIND